MRLDAYMAQYWPDPPSGGSRSVWQKYIALGCVSVNGIVETSVKRLLSEDDVVTYALPETKNHDTMTLPVIYQDDNVVVIDKPVGVLTHSKGALNDEFTVADYFRPLTTYHSETNRPGIVHRLDRDTSGVIIGARNDATASLLQRQFSERKTKKTYYAVVVGTPREPEALIDLPIGRNPKAPSTFRVDANGKSASTTYKVITSLHGKSLVELRPTTGRTHQLRVHMAYIGTPILGDRVYGQEADRLYLHAAKLEITIPTGDRRVFESPLPSSFHRQVQSQ
jgi:23S rRNA pseudouridine1911/1915/1917 synthase